MATVVADYPEIDYLDAREAGRPGWKWPKKTPGRPAQVRFIG